MSFNLGQEKLSLGKSSRPSPASCRSFFQGVPFDKTQRNNIGRPSCILTFFLTGDKIVSMAEISRRIEKQEGIYGATAER